VNHSLDQGSWVPVAHSQMGNKELRRGVEHNPALGADREPVPGEVAGIGVAVSSVPCIVLRNEDNRFDPVLKQLHNCGRRGTVEPY
jgi:hypothetical protein